MCAYIGAATTSCYDSVKPSWCHVGPLARLPPLLDYGGPYSASSSVDHWLHHDLSAQLHIYGNGHTVWVFVCVRISHAVAREGLTDREESTIRCNLYHELQSCLCVFVCL